VIDADGNNRRVLVRNASYPSWSPNGDLIVFDRRRGDTDDLWTVRPDGTGARLLVRNASFGAWSPDSGRIAFSRFVGKNVDIWVRSLATGAEHRVTRSR